MADRFVDTGGGGRWNGYSRGFRTTDGSSCVTSVTQRTFWECCTSPVASSCCGVYEMTSSLWALKTVSERPNAFVEFVTSAPLPSLASEPWAP